MGGLERVLIPIISFEGEPIRPCKRVEVAQLPADGLSNSICSRSARGQVGCDCLRASKEPPSLLTQKEIRHDGLRGY